MASAGFPATPAAAPGVVMAVSDVHLGATTASPSIAASIESNFLQFLRFAAVRCIRLVLVGDIFDLWAHPLDRRPPDSLAELVASAPRLIPICSALAQIAETVDVVYVTGNHDDYVTQKDVDLVISPRVRVCSKFVDGGITYEHGCDYDIGCAAASSEARPIGYYASRCGATSGRRPDGTSNLFKCICSVTGDLTLAMMHSAMSDKKIVERIWKKTIKSSLGRRPRNDDVIIMATKTGSVAKRLLDVASELSGMPATSYAPRFAASVESALGRMVNATVGQMDYWQDHCMNRDGTRSVVFGHTHVAHALPPKHYNTGTMGSDAVRVGRGTFFMSGTDPSTGAATAVICAWPMMSEPADFSMTCGLKQTMDLWQAPSPATHIRKMLTSEKCRSFRNWRPERNFPIGISIYDCPDCGSSRAPIILKTWHVNKWFSNDATLHCARAECELCSFVYVSYAIDASKQGRCVCGGDPMKCRRADEARDHCLHMLIYKIENNKLFPGSPGDRFAFVDIQ